MTPNKRALRRERGSARTTALARDDGAKPSQSYAVLIGMAIVAAPGKRLTLAQIYKWISDNFSYDSAAETWRSRSARDRLEGM